MKRIICFALALTFALALASCNRSDKKRLCANSWESSVDVLTFTEGGKVLRNFESEEDSVSYYKLSNGKITLYTEEGEAFGVTFDYSFDGENFILGKALYTPIAEKDSK